MSFLGNLVNAVEQKAGQVYHTATNTGHPVQATSNTMAPQALAQIQNAKHGVLANNPQAQQQYIQSTNASRFNPVMAASGAFGSALNTTARGIGNAVVNTAQVPYSTGRVGLANLTGNKPALQQAHKALTSDTANNLAWNDAYRQTANEVAGAIASRNYINKTTAANDQAGAVIAKAYGNTPQAQLYGQLVAEAGKNQNINDYLGDVGLNQNTSKLQTGIRLGAPIISAGAQTALQATGAGAGEKLAAQAAAKLTAEQAGKQLLKTAAGYGAANAGISMLSPAAQGSTNVMDYLKAGGAGLATGAALPVLGAAGGRLAATKAGQVVTNGLNDTRAGAVNVARNQMDHIKTNRGITAQQNALKAEIAGHQQQLNSLPVTNHTAAETLQRKIDAKSTQIANLEASRPQTGVTKAINTAKNRLTPVNQGGYIGNPFFKDNEQLASNAAVPIQRSLPTESDPALTSSLANAADNLVTKAGQDTASYGTAKAGDIAQAKYGKVAQPTASSLHQEALKYKSADEFVNAQRKNIKSYYRGVPDNSSFTEMGIKPPESTSNGMYVTSKKGYAKTFAGKNGTIQNVEAEVKNPYVVDKNNMHIIEGAGTWPEKIDELKSKGYDSIAAPDGQVYVFDRSKQTNLLSKQQLTDIYNEAHATNKPSTPTVPTQATKREIAELDRKINAFGSDNTPAKQTLIDRRNRRQAELSGGSTVDSQLAAGKAKLAELDNVMHQTDTLGRQIDAERKIYNGANEQQNFVKAAGHKLGSDDVLYHGTAKGNKFTSFDSSKAQTGNRGNHIYLTDNAEAAKYHSWASDQSAQLKSPTFDLSKGTESRVGEVLPVKLAKDAKIKQLDHTPTPQEIDQLKQQGYHGASFKEDLYNNAEDIPTHLINPDKMKGSTTTVLFDGKKAQVQSKSSLMDKLHIKPINEGGYVRIPGGVKDPAPDLHPAQKEFINEYANMLESQGSGNGVSIMPDGTRASNNFRTAENKGKAMTKQDWFDQARQDIESGKAAYGASDEYKQLPSLSKRVQPATQPAKKQLPGESQKSSVSSDSSVAQLKRSEMTGKALSTPTKAFTPDPAHGIYTQPKASEIAKMTPDSYAKTFGVSKDEAAKELAKPVDTPKTRPVPKQKPQPLSAAENTAKNPMKVSIPEVTAGNYEQARINPQVASHPVNYATGQALDAIHGLHLDTSTFGKMVEGDIKPRNAKEAAAVQAYKDLSNRTHATSQALGGNTPYVENYFRHEWDLSNPEQAAKFEQLASKGGTVDPYAFGGLDRQPRVFKSVAQGETAGFKLKNQNLKDEIANYGSGSAHALKQQALAKALVEADMGEANKPHTFDLGGGKSILLSDKGMREAKGYAKNLATDNKAIQAYRKGNRGFKQMLLSVSQFHPINISVLRASPTMLAEGHPVRAAKGIFDTFAAQASKDYSHKLQTAAMRDSNAVLLGDGTKSSISTLEASARLGTPIKFGSDYSAESKVGFGNGGLGEKAIFERAMPAEHIQMVKAALEDLTAEGKSLDSKEAHALGTRINEIMGFVNTEARNLDKGTQRRLGDLFLALQFTWAKWATVKSAVSEGGLAGDYARRSIAANSAAAAVVALGIGYALHQKSDNINDVLLRSVFHPSVPTPLKDKKGNTEELGLPATTSSEVLGLLGFSLKRGSNGHLSVDWKGGNIPTNAANYGRSRLAVLPATGLKVATNTDYAGKPLYDPTASAKTKAIQAATTIGTGALPIGGQGLAQTNIVKSHLPKASQEILNANAPGSNPLVKSIGSAFGLTSRTDKTTGQGLQTTQYFDALAAAKKGLNANDTAAYNAIHPQTKNPVTGNFQTQPTIYDSQQRATTYLKNPNVLAADNKLNQTLKSQGQAIDPFFNLSPDQQNIALNYSALAQGDTRRSNFQKAYPFLSQLSNDRNSFFSALPAGSTTDVNGNSKAQLPSNLQYPTLNANEQALVDKYYSTTSPTTKKQLLNDPAMAAAVGKVKAYSDNIANTRRVPTAQQIPGYTPPAPKNPNSKSTGATSKTTYDPKTNTWTRVATKSGKTTVIDANGNQTVTNNGTTTRKTSTRTTSSGSSKGTTTSSKTPGYGTKGAFTAYKSDLTSTIAAARKASTPKTYKLAKVNLSSKMKGTKMLTYKTPKLASSIKVTRKRFA